MAYLRPTYLCDVHGQEWKYTSGTFQSHHLPSVVEDRVWSIEDIDIVKSKCEIDTIKVVTMSEDERARWKDATEYMYDKYDDMFSPGLLDSIKYINYENYSRR
jgi:hypothetical protein